MEARLRQGEILKCIIHKKGWQGQHYKNYILQIPIMFKSEIIPVISIKMFRFKFPPKWKTTRWFDCSLSKRLQVWTSFFFLFFFFLTKKLTVWVIYRSTKTEAILMGNRSVQEKFKNLKEHLVWGIKRKKEKKLTKQKEKPKKIWLSILEKKESNTKFEQYHSNRNSTSCVPEREAFNRIR